jgi:hypothetical protein
MRLRSHLQCMVVCLLFCLSQRSVACRHSVSAPSLLSAHLVVCFNRFRRLCQCSATAIVQSRCFCRCSATDLYVRYVFSSYISRFDPCMCRDVLPSCRSVFSTCVCVGISFPHTSRCRFLRSSCTFLPSPAASECVLWMSVFSVYMRTKRAHYESTLSHVCCVSRMSM